MSGIQIVGTVRVRSCCGYSTNDIRFQIYNVEIGGGQNFGVISGNFSFSWNTDDSVYQMSFDNAWSVCGPDGICSPDPSNPSYHNKTVESRVHEIARATFGDLVPPRVILIIGAAGVGPVAFGLLILSRRKKP